MKAILRLLRPYYAIPTPLAYLLTLYYARGGRMSGRWPGAVVSTLALALVLAGTYAINDAFDVAADRVNFPARPVASGRVRRRTAWALGVVLTAAGLTLAASCRWQFLAVLAAVVAGLTFYNAFSKRLGPGKPLLVAVLMTSLYPLAMAQAGGASGSRAGSLGAFAAWMFLTSFAYEVLKDIRDAPGDRLAGAATSPFSDARFARAAAGTLTLVGAGLLAAPNFLGCRWVYGLGALAAMGWGLLSTRLPVRWAIRALYAEFVTVGLAAAADVAILGL